MNNAIMQMTVSPSQGAADDLAHQYHTDHEMPGSPCSYNTVHAFHCRQLVAAELQNPV